MSMSLRSARKKAQNDTLENDEESRKTTEDSVQTRSSKRKADDTHEINTSTKKKRTISDAEKYDEHVQVQSASASPSEQGGEEFDADFQTTAKKKEHGVKRNRPPKVPRPQTASKDVSLVDVLKHHAQLVSQAAKDWVERYEKDKKSALSELLIMLFEVCGVQYQQNEGPLDEIDVDDVVLSLVNHARDGNVIDYYRSKQKELKGFKDNILLFWDTLILECQDGPLFDQYFMEKCMDYVIALSCTTPRVFRQMTTLVGLQLVTSLVTVAKTLCAQRETTQRQLNAEKKKRKDGPRSESLNKTLSVTHEKITMAEEMMRKIFTGLFMHRYRDVDADIRMACIKAIGCWILSYPSLFLQDLYLKYIGWTLNDKNAAVRKTSIMALQALYEVDDNVPSLGLFTERFCNRMIELADDIDISVAVCAIRLLKQLLRHQLLADDELGSLYDLLIDESPFIRRAVGELVYDHLIAQKFSNSQPVAKDTSNDISEVHIARLLQILKEFSTDPILGDYVIDSLWEDMKAMKDWKCIISLLLDDNPKIEFTDRDATNLVRVLCASIKKVVGEKIVPCTENKKLPLNKSQKEALDNSKRDVTVAMIKHYPLLLRKYLADKGKIPALVEIITYMNLELFSLKRQEQTFITVLQLIKDAFFKHGERSTLKSCIEALVFCANESQADLQDSAQNKMKELEDELVLKLRSAIKEAEVTEDEYALTVNLRRFHQLQLSRAVSSEAIFTDMLRLVKDFSNIDDEVISLLLINMYLHVMWSTKSLDLANLSEAAMDSLLSKCDNLMNQLESFADHTLESWVQGNARIQLTSTICSLFSDLWAIFSKTKLEPLKLGNLGYYPAESLLQKFWKLCEYRLNFTDDRNEEEDMNAPLDEIIQKEVTITAVAKLVAHDLVPKDFLCPKILSHFVLHGRSIEEIIKHLISILKTNSAREDLSQIYFDAVKMSYEHHQSEIMKNEEEWSSSISFKQCKDLACRLASTFLGGARDKNKHSILAIVNQGISYAFIDLPKQMSFLEAGVLPFALQLQNSDVREIIMDVKRRADGIDTDEDPSGWQPYFTFVERLQENSLGNEGIYGGRETTVQKPFVSLRKRIKVNTGRRLFEEPTTTDDDQHTGSEDDLVGDDDDTPLTPFRKASGLNSDRSANVSKESLPEQTASTSKSFDSMRTRSSLGDTNPADTLLGSATEEQLPKRLSSQRRRGYSN